MEKLTIDSRVLGRSYTVDLEDIKYITLDMPVTITGCDYCRYGHLNRTIVPPHQFGALIQTHVITNCPECLGRGFHEAGRKGQLLPEEVVAILDRLYELEDMIECARDAIEYGCLEDAEFALNGS